MVQPSNFSWFVENRVAGMAWPSAESFQFLADSGIKVLINLTENNPPAYHEIAALQNIECIHVKIKAYGTPTIEQIVNVVSLIDKETSLDKSVGIHCFMGRGRTGTILACYLMKKEGMSASVAIEETKKKRKGSIETDEQEETIRKYEIYLKEK